VLTATGVAFALVTFASVALVLVVLALVALAFPFGAPPRLRAFIALSTPSLRGGASLFAVEVFDADDARNLTGGLVA
jgi:hypothetical protein